MMTLVENKTIAYSYVLTFYIALNNIVKAHRRQIDWATHYIHLPGADVVLVFDRWQHKVRFVDARLRYRYRGETRSTDG